ncbi:MAG: UDP-N-acetylmuramoyl-tripeptide--D-alanyl-D-alanine ligase [Mailhella sp.]|nr:UDP-N-acetylmuramoyl-tripeptide--D-alanyl-D-alanine ligase [Mailhella sp.]
MTLEQAAQAAGAHILYPADIELCGAASDNRKVLPGQLFAAIPGERSDGHDFAAAAVEAGAAAVLAQRDPFDGRPLAPVLLVENSVAALGRIGNAWRRAFGGRVAGITGTAGKTTTKELLAHILSQKGKTARNLMNLNTQVGMPISMMAADGDEAFWVMEAGISNPGDMDELGPVMEPDLAIVLNVGAGHTQGLGQKGTAHYKARLLRYIRKDGIALVSADYDDLVREVRGICPGAMFFSAAGRSVPYRASYLGIDANGRGNYRLWLDGASLDVNCALSGSYAAENIIAAAAAAHLFGLSRDEIAQGIATAPLPAQRFARRDLPGWIIIDDTYNANPLSSGRMIEAAAELAHDRTFACVMGEMLELGSEAEPEHRELGRTLAASGCHAVFWAGGHAAEVEEGLKEGQYNGFFAAMTSPEDFRTALEAWDASRKKGRPGLMLFKGSRGNRLERYVNLFAERNSHAV